MSGTIILNPNAPTETDQYVLRDADGKPLSPSNTPRVLNPVRRNIDGERQIVEANVFDLPFKLKDGRYDPEMLDPDSGFLKEAPKTEGPYGIWFGSENKLYASILRWSGYVLCHWVPSHSRDFVGFRGATSVLGSGSSVLPPELLENEEESFEFDVRKNISDAQRYLEAGNYKAASEKLGMASILLEKRSGKN